MPDELKPCPFCGASATLENNQSLKNPNSDTLYWIECSKCMAFDFEGYTSANCCISVWNTRPLEDALQARITELEKDYAALLKSNSNRFSAQIQNACENSLVLKKWIEECNLLRIEKAELETQLTNLRANSRTKIELDTCRSLNESLRDENVRLIAKIKKLKERFGCAKQKN